MIYLPVARLLIYTRTCQAELRFIYSALAIMKLLARNEAKTEQIFDFDKICPAIRSLPFKLRLITKSSAEYDVLTEI